MIRGVHTMFVSSAPEELRAFIRDKLGFPYTDVGGGWLIFDLPEADMGCHPADAQEGKSAGAHQISFYCDDIERTVAELRGRGVEFTGDVVDAGFGLTTHFRMPGGVEVMLYQPKYGKGPASGDEAVPVVCRYLLKPEREPEFAELVGRHWTTLHGAGLVTNEPASLARGADKAGNVAFIERFSWKTAASAGAAHETPAVMKLWEPMGALCEDMEFWHVEAIEG